MLCAGFAANVAGAQDAKTSPAQTQAEPNYVPSARIRAIRWASQNDGIAVSVRLGTDPQGTPTQIEDILSQTFREAEVDIISFFFEQNDIRATRVMYHYGKRGGVSDGPFFLRDAIEGARAAAAQHLFYLEHPELGF